MFQNIFHASVSLFPLPFLGQHFQSSAVHKYKRNKMHFFIRESTLITSLEYPNFKVLKRQVLKLVSFVQEFFQDGFVKLNWPLRVC